MGDSGDDEAMPLAEPSSVAAGYGGGALKKRRVEHGTDIERRLENLMLRLGEKTSTSLDKGVEGLAQVLEGELDSYRAHIINVLVDCADLPSKLCVYTTLVGLLNATNHVFGGEVVEALVQRLRDTLRKCEYGAALNLILFVCDLVNCHVVSPHSCMTFLESLLTAVVQQHDVPQVRRDWYAYAVLHALPFVGLVLSDRRPEQLQQLLDNISSYLKTREKLHVSMLRVWCSAADQAQLDYLDSLFTQIDNARRTGWQYVFVAQANVRDSFQHIFADALQHNLPNFIPPAHRANATYPLPSVVFRLFDVADVPDDGPRLPPSDSIERFLVEHDLRAILDQWYLERKDCASALLSYQRGGNSPSIPLNYVILEVVFGGLLNLPRAKHLELFYGSLLIELCKLQPNSMPQVLAQAAELLYQRVDTMQPACLDRVVNWFSYHLSNFALKWSWDDWMDCLSMKFEAPRQLFVREVLQKVLRFTYHEKVCEIVPTGFTPLLPKLPQPNFRFAKEDSEILPGADTARELATAIRQKCKNEQIVDRMIIHKIIADLTLEILEIVRECKNDDEMSGFNALAVEVFVLTLLNLGSKTFSHSFAALAKYHPALKSLTENNEDAQLCVLRCVYELWSSHSQMICVLVDKLLKMQIVECGVVVHWMFSAEMKDEFIRMWMWEMLESALLKLSKHVLRLKEELDDAEASAPSISDVDMSNKEEGETADDDEDGAEQSVKARAAAAIEDLRSLRERVAAAQAVQKDLLLTLFQNFTILLTEHLLSAETDGVDFDTPWYQCVIGRLRHMFLVQHEEAAAQTDNLEMYLFTSDIDPHILEVFHQFCSLRR